MGAESDGDGARLPSNTKSTKSRNEAADLSRWHVEAVGEDFGRGLDEDAAVVQLMLPLGDSGIDFAVEIATSKGFFLGGLLPNWGRCDHLLLQRLQEEPQWDSIVLDSDRSRSLLRTLQEDR